MPIPAHGRRRRSLPPLRAAGWVLLGLVASWAGWAEAGVAHAERWARPVPGPVVAPFSLGSDPFAAGQHRGADLRARPGRAVVSACGGVVAFAGSVPRSGRVVSVECGRWRVTYLPLGSVRVRRGDAARPGTALGTVAPGHGGLHVGVRRAGRRFGYVDPERFFGAAAQPPLPVGMPRAGPRAVVRVRVPRAGPRPAPVPTAAPAPVLRPGPVPAAAPSRDAAPWPVWLGLALLSAGAVAGRRVGRARRRRARVGRVVRA